MPLDTTTIPDRHDRSGSKTRKFFNITGPTSYATGGEALDLGIGRVELVSPEFASNGTDLRYLRWDYANKKMKWFTEAGAEVSAATNLSTYSARIEVIGV
jgi:hypothetical protein